eukprot:1994336-Ditylum_brightwellii.AAC.1
MSIVLSFNLAKCICLPIRCKLLNSVHNARSGPVCLENRKSCICSLEPSWVSARESSDLGTYVKGDATRGVHICKMLDLKVMG